MNKWNLSVQHDFIFHEHFICPSVHYFVFYKLLWHWPEGDHCRAGAIWVSPEIGMTHLSQGQPDKHTYAHREQRTQSLFTHVWLYSWKSTACTFAWNSRNTVTSVTLMSPCIENTCTMHTNAHTSSFSLMQYIKLIKT